MLLRVQYPTSPAGIDPHPVVHVITIKTMIATIVKKIFHPLLSSLDVLYDWLELLEEDVPVEEEFTFEPPPILC